jgi:ferredoxin
MNVSRSVWNGTRRSLVSIVPESIFYGHKGRRRAAILPPTPYVVSVRHLSLIRKRTVDWLVKEKRIDPNVVDELLRAFPTQNPSVSDVKQLGDSGLQQLVDAVKREKSVIADSEHIRINVLSHDASAPVHVVARVGDTLQTLVERDTVLSEYMECSCSGIAACGTCHVYVDPTYFRMLPPPEEAELDILDLVEDRKENSRLGCQFKLTKQLHDATFTLPEEVIDLH